ncbi:MAG: AIR synthase-related protein [Methanobrevibacter sp.]|nr:AIR synthase-related protein [Methanobrevibacter sp.]
MDIESYVKKCIAESESEDEIVEKLSSIIRFYKDISVSDSVKLSRAVFDEVSVVSSLDEGRFLSYPKSNIHMGEFGVGSRGKGDFFVHSKIAEIIRNSDVDSVVNPTAQDDGGVVEIDEDSRYVTTAIDGIHSRLGDYPFLAGFHTARATLRDVCVMGATPVSLISDIHLADDGDVAKILDFTAGICAVSELTGVPLVSGSTLRVGGDMVLGDRLVGAVGAVGTSSVVPTARSEAVAGDVILMTEGSGGGTVTTTAIYNNFPEVIDETLNVQFINASRILNSIDGIHAMTDITNGGINGDANEINKTTGLGIHLYEKRIVDLINPRVYDMFKKLDIDPLGVSIDSLMVIAPANLVDVIVDSLTESNIGVDVIGVVNDSGVTTIESADGEVNVLVPKFREAAYTPVKKVVDSLDSVDFDEGAAEIDRVTREIISKKDEIVRWIRNRYE